MVQNEQQRMEEEVLSDVQGEKYNKMKKTELMATIASRDVQLQDMEEKWEKREAEFEKIRESEKSYKEQLIRMQADFENYKKREEKKKLEFMEYAKQELICQLLSVIDNLERASSYTKNQSEDGNIEDIKEGLRGILKIFRDILEKEGLKPIKAVGEKFDPYCHEAIMNVESEKFPEDTIVEELVKGYYLKSKVIRPSVVKVSKGTSDKEKDKGAKGIDLKNNDNEKKDDNTNNK